LARHQGGFFIIPLQPSEKPVPFEKKAPFLHSGAAPSSRAPFMRGKVGSGDLLHRNEDQPFQRYSRSSAQTWFQREKNNSDKSAPDKSAPDNEERQSGFEPSLAIRGEPAPIDVAAFGKRLAEIIAKAVRASRKRHKFRK
jgi:hypothetical protein